MAETIPWKVGGGFGHLHLTMRVIRPAWEWRTTPMAHRVVQPLPCGQMGMARPRPQGLRWLRPPLFGYMGVVRHPQASWATPQNLFFCHFLLLLFKKKINFFKDVSRRIALKTHVGLFFLKNDGIKYRMGHIAKLENLVWV